MKVLDGSDEGVQEDEDVVGENLGAKSAREAPRERHLEIVLSRATDETIVSEKAWLGARLTTKYERPSFHGSLISAIARNID